MLLRMLHRVLDNKDSALLELPLSWDIKAAKRVIHGGNVTNCYPPPPAPFGGADGEDEDLPPQHWH